MTSHMKNKKHRVKDHSTWKKCPRKEKKGPPHCQKAPKLNKIPNKEKKAPMRKKDPPYRDKSLHEEKRSPNMEIINLVFQEGGCASAYSCPACERPWIRCPR